MARRLDENVAFAINCDEVPDHLLKQWAETHDAARDYLVNLHPACRDPRKASGQHGSVKTAAQPIRFKRPR